MSNFPIEKPTINIFSLFPALVFFRTFINCLNRIHKNFSKSKLCAADEETRPKSDSDMQQKLRYCSSREDDNDGRNIRREDVEMVMGRMGFSFELEDDDDDERKMIDHEEMSRLFEEKEASLEEVKAAFDVFDENKDGFLDSEEVKRVVCNLLGFNGGLRIEECTKMIRPFDLNGDGMIDFQEFVKLMENSFS